MAEPDFESTNTSVPDEPLALVASKEKGSADRCSASSSFATTVLRVGETSGFPWKTLGRQEHLSRICLEDTHPTKNIKSYYYSF